MIISKIKRIISGIIAAMLIVSALPASATSNNDGFFGKIAQTVVIDTNSDIMLKYGRVERFTENNVGTLHYADEIPVVPIRFLSETFHGLIEYDEITNKTRVSFESGQINYIPGSKTAYVYEDEIQLSIAPFLKDGVSYVPLTDFITVLGMGYVTGHNGMIVISPVNDMDKPYFTNEVFDRLDEILYAQTVEEVTLYVSTKGTVDGEGTKEKPFDSIYTAKDL